MADEPQIPAGWYRDPQNPDQPRYWDGVAWDPGASVPPGGAIAAEPQSTNGFAIASLVSGLLWLAGLGSSLAPAFGFAIGSWVYGIVWLSSLGPILALVFGYRAKKQIAASNGREAGGGLATAGIVLGWVGIGLTIVLILFTIMVINALNNMGVNTLNIV
jgi:hypothetical protein